MYGVLFACTWNVGQPTSAFSLIVQKCKACVLSCCSDIMTKISRYFQNGGKKSVSFLVISEIVVETSIKLLLVLYCS